MSRHGGDLEGMFAVGCSLGVQSALFWTLPPPLFVGAVLTEAVAVLYMAGLDPQRTAKAEFAAQAKIPVTDPRIAQAFAALSRNGRALVQSPEALDHLLARGQERAAAAAEERRQKALFVEQ